MEGELQELPVQLAPQELLEQPVRLGLPVLLAPEQREQQAQ